MPDRLLQFLLCASVKETNVFFVSTTSRICIVSEKSHLNNLLAGAACDPGSSGCRQARISHSQGKGGQKNISLSPRRPHRLRRVRSHGILRHLHHPNSPADQNSSPTRGHHPARNLITPFIATDRHYSPPPSPVFRPDTSRIFVRLSLSRFTAQRLQYISHYSAPLNCSIGARQPSTIASI